MPPTPAQLHGSPLRLPHQGARNNVLTRSDNMPAREIQPRLRVQNIGDLGRFWDVLASPSTGQRHEGAQFLSSLRLFSVIYPGRLPGFPAVSAPAARVFNCELRR